MLAAANWLFDYEVFRKRNMCGPGWEMDSWLEYVHVVGDVTIAASYLMIPFIMLWALRTARAVSGKVPETPLLLLYGAFIVLCGMTHAIDALMFNFPMYRLSGLMKVMTAIVSVVTAFHLLLSLPRLLSLITGGTINYENQSAETLKQRYVKQLQKEREHKKRPE